MQAPQAPTQRYEGKTKIIRVQADGSIAMFFKDAATANNGQLHAVFAGKGALNAQISAIFFRHLQRAGVATHFLATLDAPTLHCQQVQMLPLEVVVRFKAAGSLCRRLGVPAATPCQPPLLEFYYKCDALQDPLVNLDHIRLLQLATPDSLAAISVHAHKAAAAVQQLCAQVQLDLYDLKFEYGHHNATLLLADEISPDTCRWRDVSSGQILDKDIFRQGNGNLLHAYQTVLARLQSWEAQAAHA